VNTQGGGAWRQLGSRKFEHVYRLEIRVSRLPPCLTSVFDPVFVIR